MKVLDFLKNYGINLAFYSSHCSLPLAIIPHPATLAENILGRIFGSFLIPERTEKEGNSNFARLSRSGYYLNSVLVSHWFNNTEGSVEAAYHEMQGVQGKLAESALVQKWLEVARAHLIVSQAVSALDLQLELADSTFKDLNKL